MRERKILSYLIDFKVYLNKKGLALLSQKAYLTGVKAFYWFYFIEVPTLKQKKGNVLKKNKHNVTKDDIREALKVKDPLETAVVLVGCSSGLSANEIINLKVSDFKSGQAEDKKTTLELTRHKTDFEFVSYLSKGATEAVEAYLQYRGRTSKTNDAKRHRQLAKQKVTDDSNMSSKGKQTVDFNFNLGKIPI